MADVKKLALVEYTPAQMFDLVDRVEDYPQYLPWCGGSEVVSRSAEETVATLHINYHGIKSKFTTQNSKTWPSLMVLQLREGPFKHLEGEWHFIPLGNTACKIEFRLHYEFSNRLLEKMLGPVFHHVANTFVDSFVKRAAQAYPKGAAG